MRWLQNMGHRVELSDNQPPYEPPRSYFAGKPCPYCGIEMEKLPKAAEPPRTTKQQRQHQKRRSSRATTIDHATPRSRGGPGHGLNRVVVCWQCNNDKGALTLAEWHEYLTQDGDERAVFVALYMARIAGVVLSD